MSEVEKEQESEGRARLLRSLLKSVAHSVDWPPAFVDWEEMVSRLTACKELAETFVTKERRG